MSGRLAAVDAYLASAKPFAQPILRHLREAVHRVAPEVEEQMKWARPFFVYRGVILGNLSAFNQHCSFGLWGTEMAEALRAGGVPSSEGMGTFGRIGSVADLPPLEELEAYIRRAVELIASGERARSIQRVAKPGRPKRVDAPVPEALVTALGARAGAADRFAAMSLSRRREYTDWVDGAKREETRARRAATAAEWIAEGKGLNWRYERTA